MRIRSSAVLLTLAAVSLGGGLASAQKLDKDDKKFLDEVRPLMLRDEEASYKKLSDKADRLEFQKIFWTRRDPDLATPVNEFQEQYQKARLEADRNYGVAGRVGSTTDCGRTYILLGKPDDVEQHTDAAAMGSRAPETWTYRDKPGRKFEGGQAALTFDADCAGTASLTAQIERMARSKIMHPNIDYRLGKDKHLVPLAELLPRDTQARALFKQPRQDFPVAARTFYLKVADGGTAIVGLLRGELGTAPAEGGAAPKTVRVSIAASAVAEDGAETGWAEQTMNAPVAADGSFLGSFKVGLKPGKYTLKVGAVDLKTQKGALASLPLEVPDLARVATGPDGATRSLPSAASLMLIQQVEELAPGRTEDPAHPFAAFALGPLLMHPFFPSTLHKTDEIWIFYQVYDLTLDAAGAADGVAVLTVNKAGRPVARTEAAIKTAVGGSIVGPVPLASYDAGRYVVQLKLNDKLAKQEITQEVPFEIAP